MFCKHVTCQVRHANQLHFAPLLPSPPRPPTSPSAGLRVRVPRRLGGGPLPAGNGRMFISAVQKRRLLRRPSQRLQVGVPAGSGRWRGSAVRTGGRAGRRLSRSVNAAKRGRATYPTASSGDNELQVAGKTNESINGSQHEKGFRGWATQLEVGGGEGEKRRQTDTWLLPASAFSPGRRRGKKKKGGEKFGGGGVAGVRRHQVEDSLSLRIDT